MEISLELVERLKEKANVSYAQAKQALEYSQGNLLDALIYLEESGVIPREKQTYYSTQTRPVPPAAAPLMVQEPVKRNKEGAAERRRGLLEALRRWLVENELEVWRRQEPVTALPMLILLTLLVLAFWVVVPMLVLGLFFGFRYRFSGPDLEDEGLNSVMAKVADTADEVGRRVMEELHAQQERHTKNRPDHRGPGEGE